MSDSGSSSSGSSSSSSVKLFDPSPFIPQSDQQPQTQNQPSDDPLPSTSFDPTSSQSTQLPLSSFKNNYLLTQDTQTTSIPNTQATTDNNFQQHAPKNTSSTAPTRAWISQRIAKTIHIDQDNSQKIHESQSFQLNPNQHNPNSSSQRIIELGIVEQQISQLLALASDVLGSLTPPLNQDQSSTDQAIETFSTSISGYFELLNKIQLGLRTSMAHLRVARISTRILFEPVHVWVPNCPIGLGNIRLNHPSTSSSPSAMDFNQEKINHDDGSSLSLGSLIAERNAWKDFVDSLQSILALHSSTPSDSLFSIS